MARAPEQPDLFLWKLEEKKSFWFWKIFKSKYFWIVVVLIIVSLVVRFNYNSIVEFLSSENTKNFYSSYWLIIFSSFSIILTFLTIWLIPKWQIKILETKKGSIDQSEFDLEKERIKLRDETRKTLAQIIGGAFFVLGLFVTYNTFELNRQGQELNREGQVTERFSKAVELIGSKDLSVRLGGLYALERIAYDSPKDHSTIMQILSAYIREKSKEYREKNKKILSSQKKTDVNEINFLDDVSQAVFIIHRRDTQNDVERQVFDWEGAIVRNLNLNNAILKNSYFASADLIYCDLTGADLSNGTFYKTNLSYTNLTKSDFSYSNLTSASLIEANLFNAKLDKVNFTNANLEKANLEFVNFNSAILNNANLNYANLKGALFTETNFTGTKLQGALLYDVDLSHIALTQQNSLNVRTLTFEQLSKAIINETTKLPEELESRRAELFELSKKNLEERKKVLGES